MYQTYALNMVPPVGLEPTQYRYYWILSPTRLPISPRRHFYGALDTIRTCDPNLRRVVLYPTELQAHEIIIPILKLKVNK